QLNGAKFELVRSDQGVWNFADIEGNSSTNKSYSLNQMKFYDGQVAVTDMQERKPRAVYDHIDLIVSDFAPDKPFAIDARAHLPGAGKEATAPTGKAGPLRRDGIANTPFE